MGVPVFQTMGMLGGELPAGTGGDPDDHRHIELTARHVPDGGGVVDDLIERQQAEIDRHDLDDRPHAAERRTDAGADEGGFGQRRIANPVRAELVQQAPAYGVAAAISPDILAHQEDALILEHGLADRVVDGLAISRLDDVADDAGIWCDCGLDRHGTALSV